MKTRFILALAVAITAASFAQAGFGIAKSVSSNRGNYQPPVITPTPIFATPAIPTVPPVIAAPIPYVQPQHLTDALQLVDEINATHSLGIFEDDEGVEINRYGGSWSGNNPSYIRFMDENNGIYPSNFTECAPFVSRLLQHTYGWNWNNHPFDNPKENLDNDTTASPNPWEYLALIEQTRGFEQHVTNIHHAKPGDIISIHYTSGTTGHTAILLKLEWGDPMPYPQDGVALNVGLAGTTYYRMQIIDSTASPHSDDTREFTVTHDDNSVSEHTITGLGIGTMGIFLDNSGEVVGHTWSLPNADYGTQGWISEINTRLKLQNDRHMVVGRLPANP